MSQVNLLPPEIQNRELVRRRTTMILLACIGVIALILAFYLLQNQRLSSVNADIETQDATNAGIQAQINDLSEFATLQAQAQESESRLAAAWQGEVSFSGLLMDVSHVIPSDMALSALAFQLTPAATGATTPATGTTTFVGTGTATGTAASAQTVATWLERLGSVKGWENPWVSNGTLGENGSTYTINSTVDLSDAVVTPRGKAGAP